MPVRSLARSSLLGALPLRAALVVCIGLAIGLIAASCTSESAPSGPESPDASSPDTGGAEPDAGASAPTQPSIAGPWQLSSMSLRGAPVELPTTTDFTIEIERGMISGNLGCNSVTGLIDTTPTGGLALTDLSQTEMACDLLAFEVEYSAALAASDSYQVGPDGLRFFGEVDGAPSELFYLAGYQPTVASLPLQRTVWRFDTIFAGEGVNRTASTPDMSLAEVFLEIDGPQGILTSSGCDDFSVGISTNGERDGLFALGPEAGSPVCSGDSNIFAAFEGMVAASGYMIDGDRLTLIGLPGETVGFRAVE